MASVRIEDSSGAERATLPLVSLAKEQAVRKNTLARVTVSRDELNSVSGLTPGTDRVFVVEGGVDTFGGLLRTPGRSGGKPTLIAGGFETYLARAEPVSLGQTKTSAASDTLINECISATPQLTAGTVNSVGSSETYIFSGTTQLEKARTVARTVGGELTFLPDLTVDFADTRGGDKTGTILSPANDSFVENTFRVDRDGVAGKTTHLRVYGVGQGTGQIEANIVPSGDSASYTNKVTYSHPTWTSGDDKLWGSRSNNDLKNVSMAQTWGQTLIAEMQDAETRVHTIVKGNTVNLGDEFHVEHSDEGVDEDLRAVEVTKLIDASGGTRYETVFSNYADAHHEPVAEDHRDTNRYNLSFEGDLTTIQKTGSRPPVDATHDYIIRVHYPDDVVFEVDAELHVAGEAFRAYSSGAAAVDAAENQNQAQRVYGKDGESEDAATDSDTFVTVDVPTSPAGSFSGAKVMVNFLNSSGSSDDYDWEVVNTTTTTTLATDTGNTVADTEGLATNYNFSSSQVSVDDRLKFNMTDGTLGNGGSRAFPLSYMEMVVSSAGEHTHNPEPGILDWDGNDQSPAHYPENVKVVTPSTPGGIDLGDNATFDTGADDGAQRFEAVLDLTGELSSGWNTITLESDGLGHLDATFSADLFRQSL